MDKDVAPSDNNGNANGDEGIQQIYDNKFEETEQDCKNESEICGESNKNDQEVWMNDDKNNSKAKEGDSADSKDNGNSDPNTDKETEQQSEREGGSTNPIKAVDVTENEIDEDSKSTETQTGQDNMTNADQDKSKAIEGAETEDNGNGSSTTDKDNENQSNNQKGSTNPINKAEGTTKNDAHTKEDGESQSSETKTGQNTTIKDDKDNSKYNESAELGKTDNGLTTTDIDTEKQSETRRGSTNPINEAEGTTTNDAHKKVDGDMQSTETCPSTDYDMCEDVNIAYLKRDLVSVIEERNAYKLSFEELYDLVKHKSDDTAVSTNKESTKPDPLKSISTYVPSMIEQLKRRFQELEEAVSVHERELDQERKHNEIFKKMHKDLQDFATKECDQRHIISKFFSSKSVANADNIVPDISECYRHLQSKLDEYKNEVDELKSKTNQQKSQVTSLKREIDNLKGQLQKKTKQCDQTLKKLEDQKKVYVDKQIHLQKINQEKTDEIKAVKNELDEARTKINSYEANEKQYRLICEKLRDDNNKNKSQIQQKISHIQRKDQTIEQLKKHTETLEIEHNKLTLRLSKLAGAHLTRNNPNITDLSDGNRPTKLAEKYSELYDNEWTDAYEEYTDAWKVDEEACVKTMLDLLRKADAECLKLLQPHRDILKTLTSVTVKLEKPAVTQDTYADLETCNPTKDESTQTDLILVDAKVQTETCDHTDELVHSNNMRNCDEEKGEPMDTDENNTRKESSLEITELSGRSQCQQFDSSTSTETPAVQGTKVDDLHPEGPAASYVTKNQDGSEEQLKEEEQMVHDQMDIAEIVINGEFTEEQKKAVSDMRRLCGTKLEQERSISKVIAHKIAKERGVDIKSSENVMIFITKCAQLCWYMAIQEPPVVIGFRETAADEDFDKDIYKAYTKVGKKVDFVVWPPVYLYKDGPMLCKGTAQGKD